MTRKREKAMLKDAIKDYEFREDMSVDELVNQMEKAWGFTAGKVSVGVNILERMIKTQGLRQVSLVHWKPCGHWHARRVQRVCEAETR